MRVSPSHHRRGLPVGDAADCPILISWADFHLQADLAGFRQLHRLTLDAPAHNTQARYNVCPTTTIDTVIEREDRRELVPMRWVLAPSWWSKPLKE